VLVRVPLAATDFDEDTVALHDEDGDADDDADAVADADDDGVDERECVRCGVLLAVDVSAGVRSGVLVTDGVIVVAAVAVPEAVGVEVFDILGVRVCDGDIECEIGTDIVDRGVDVADMDSEPDAEADDDADAEVVDDFVDLADEVRVDERVTAGESECETPDDTEAE